MARKPTPAGATPADTAPSAAVPAPAEAPAASPTANIAAADAAGGAPDTPLSDQPAADPDSASAGDEDRDLLEVGDARVLIAFDEHVPDDLVSGTLADLRVLERDGKVDTHPDAVAYVWSLQA